MKKMSLERFALEGCPLEVRVSWFSRTLWFVPTDTEAALLANEDISRGCIWTARELLELFSIPGLTSKEVQTIATVKAEFAGRIVNAKG